MRTLTQVVWALLTVLACAFPANATVFFDESFETAAVPLAPNSPTQGAPSGWRLWRSWGNDGLPLNANGQDICTFTTERAHSGSISIKQDFTSVDTANGFDS